MSLAKPTKQADGEGRRPARRPVRTSLDRKIRVSVFSQVAIKLAIASRPNRSLKTSAISERITASSLAALYGPSSPRQTLTAW